MMKIARVLLCIVFLVSPTLAWNRAGHMVGGAITYQTLKLEHPDTIKMVMALLQQHPYYSRWENAVSNLPDREQNHDLYIFMLAAKWADEIRDNPTFNHPKWHYINYALTLDNTPTKEPEAENIFSAFTDNYAKLTKPDAAAQLHP